MVMRLGGALLVKETTEVSISWEDEREGGLIRILLHSSILRRPNGSQDPSRTALRRARSLNGKRDRGKNRLDHSAEW